jgi:Tfp pilus assembly protein PilN
VIRIDLKKDELSKPARPTPAELFRKFYRPIEPKVRAIVGDARSLISFLVVGAFALLPYLFYTQYRAYVISQHRSAMATMANNLTELNVEIEKLQPFQKEMEGYEQQRKIVAERIAVVNRLLNARATPVLVLDTMGQSLPPKAWLTNINYSLKDKPPSLAISGHAFTHEDISDYIEKLVESAYIQEVVLDDVSTVVEQSTEVKSFSARVQPRDVTVNETTLPRDTAGNVKVVPLTVPKK